MRASSVDRRLEAIAGTPDLTASAPTVIAAKAGMTIVFAGQWAPAYNGRGSNSQMLFHTSGNEFFVYAAESTAEWGAYNLPDGGRLIESGKFIAWARLTTTDISALLGIGRHAWVLHYPWRGAFQASAYDRALTDAEALAVARHLSLSLSQG